MIISSGSLVITFRRSCFESTYGLLVWTFFEVTYCGVSSFLPLTPLIFHVSQPYKSVGPTNVLYSLILVFRVSFVESQICLSLTKSLADSFVNICPRPPLTTLLTIAPMCVNFSKSFNCWPAMIVLLPCLPLIFKPSVLLV